MTLRDQCVEAAARAVWERNHDGDWYQAKQFGTGSYLVALHDSQAAFGAILDTLEANADEWDEAALHLATSETPPYSMIGSFIAALRIPNVEEETR